MKDRLLTRRQFGKITAGILVSFALPLESSPQAGDPGKAATLDAWLHIGPDGKITVFTGKVELGQGVLTALAQIAAEELDVVLSDIRVVSGDTELTPDEGYTSGSQSIEQSGSAIRLACAEARAVLIKAAAKRLGAPASKLKAAGGAVSSPDGKKLTYGEIAGSGLLRREASPGTRPKPAAEHTIVGTPALRLDIPAKVTGGPAFVQDLRPSGMVFGRVVRPPGPRDRLEEADLARVRAMPGVTAVVRDGSFLGVVAVREEQAVAAREALQRSAKWRAAADLPDHEKIHSWLAGRPSEDSSADEGKPAKASKIVRSLEAAYTKQYVAHASLGPSCAIALIKDAKLRIWSHTQGVYPLRRDIAAVMKMAPESVIISHAEGAGCYGHNGADDAALDAALLARAVPGRPVKVQWMRDDEFAWEPFGSAMVMKLKAGLGADGRIADWRHELWSNVHSSRPGRPGGVNLLAAWHLEKPHGPAPMRAIPGPAGGADRNALPLYDIPAKKVIRHLVKDMPLRASALRALGGYANVFASESFMDELAEAAQSDPVEFRLRHLRDPRARAVIETAAEKALWKPGPGKKGGHGRGIGFARYKNLACYVACVADVEVVPETGLVRVLSVVAAADSGQIINPKGLSMQIEGGIIQSVSWTLKESVRFDRTMVTSRDWQGYPILTFPEAPEVRVHLIDRPDERPLGSGEASQGPAAAAVVNAVSNAIGRRVRDLPLSPEKIRQQ